MQADWRDYYLVHDELQRWTDAEADAAEAALGVQLPPGYRDLVTTLGSGTVNDLVRLPSWEQLVEDQRLFQDVIQTAWFFEECDDQFTQDRGLECVMIADSLDGDMVAFHPGSRRFYVLPRHDERVYAVGNHMTEVVGWFLESGILLRPARFGYFESFVGPKEAANGSGNRTRFDQMTEAIRSLELHDVEDRDEDSCRFFVKAIGGYLAFQEGDGTDVYVHFRYLTDRSADVRERIREAAVAAGVTFHSPWSMTPAQGS